MTSIIPSVVADAEFQLATAVSIGSTSFSLASATDDDGVALPSAVYCFTIDNGSSNKEYLQGLLNGVNVTAVKSISRQTAQTTGAVRAHRVGSPCIISDFSTIAQVAKVMNGLGALDGASPLIYDVEPTISDRKQIATLGKVLDLVTGGTVTFDNQTLSGVLAGETIVAGNSVYLKESDQRWWLTDADTVATVDNVRLGIALGSGSAGVAITGGVLLEGAYTTTGLTAGARYYLGNTAGALSATVGTNPMVVGLALSTTRLLFSPSRFSIPTFNEKAALAGDGGTPSSTNKYKTQNRSMTAGATINGATLPVPVYQDTTSFKYLPCIGNDTTKIKFQGFATSNSTDTNPINVQFDGVVGGFTGLTRGVKYYLSDTSGVISTTPGTNEIYIGIAISTTEILIQNGQRTASGVQAFSSATTVTITTGFRVNKVTIHAFYATGTGSANVMSHGNWTPKNGNSCAYLSDTGAPGPAYGTRTDYSWWLDRDETPGRSMFGLVDTITETSFRLNSQFSDSAQPIVLAWSAEGDF